MLRFGEILQAVVRDRPALKGPVHIFGLSYLSRLYYDAIAALDYTSNVSAYPLNP